MYFPYEFLFCIIEQFFPRYVDISTAHSIHMMMQVVNFMTLYTDWWPSFILCLVTFVVQYAGRAVFLNEPVNEESIQNLLVQMSILTLNLWAVRLITTKLGLISIEAEMIREGNNQLLNNL